MGGQQTAGPRANMKHVDKTVSKKVSKVTPEESIAKFKTGATYGKYTGMVSHRQFCS